MAQQNLSKAGSLLALGIAMCVTITSVPLNEAFAQRNKKEQAAQQAKGPSVSKNFQKPLSEIQGLINAKNWSGAQALLPALQQIPNPTPYDTYIIDNFAFEVARGLNDQNAMAEAVVRLAGSEFTPEATRSQFYSFLTNHYIQTKNWQQALNFGKQALALKPDDMEFRVTMAAVARQVNDFSTAENVLQEGIKVSTAAGQKPKEELYREIAATRQKQFGRSPEFIQAVREWVAEYPKSENWNILLFEYQTRAKLSSRQSLDLFRLMVLTGALESAGEYIEYADAAINSAAPGETKFALEQGAKAGKIQLEDNEVKELIKRADVAIAADQKDAASFLKSAQSSKNGELMAQVGYAHLSYGENEKAVAALKDAQARGGLRNNDDINLRLGIALSNTGDKAAAQEAFGRVKDNPKLVELAQLWALYTKVR